MHIQCCCLLLFDDRQ